MPYIEISNDENANPNSANTSSQMLKMRETQILKLQTEVDQKEKQLQGLKQKLACELKTSRMVISEYALKAEAIEVQLSKAGEVIVKQNGSIENLNKFIAELQAKSVSESKNIFSAAVALRNFQSRSGHYLKGLAVLAMSIALISILKVFNLI